MPSNPIIGGHLKRTSGYKDVPPLILAGGELGMYFVNSEAVLEDGKEFDQYGEDAGAMHKHALNVADRNPKFREIVDILAQRTRSLFAGTAMLAVSGGQRRDWLFSAPVARVLGLPHIALYKQDPSKPERVDVLSPDGTLQRNYDLTGVEAVHIADLITEGSSWLSEEDPNVGWVPMLRNRGVFIHSGLAVVTRLQGGEERLAKIGVSIDAEVAIDEAYLREHSENPEVAVAYFRDPTAWSKEFLAKHGARQFARFFNPNGGKADRARRFIARYGDYLGEIGRFAELDELVRTHHGITVQQAAEGKTRYDVGQTFTDKWREAVERKNSTLCSGLDPAEYWQAPENTLPEGADKFEWCMEFVVKVAPSSAAIKINRNFVKDLSREEMQTLVERIHELGMVAIDDSKLSDIGNTNDSGLYHSQVEGFDAVTYASFPGNAREAVTQAHGRGLGLISLVIMSNPEFEQRKNMIIDGMRGFEYFAKEVADYGLDAMVIGAPSPSNHIKDHEIRRVREITGPKLVLMPAVGAQGGDAKYVISVFGDNVIANVGRSIMYAKDPAKEAEKYRVMLNSLRGAAV